MSVSIARTAAEEAYGLALPHRRMEDWRWTDLRQLIDKPYPPRQQVTAEVKDVERLLGRTIFHAVAATRMVFVNGVLDAAHSKLGQGAALSQMDADEPVAQMNAAFATDGAKLTLSGTVDTPVELVFIATSAAPRTIAVKNVIEIAPALRPPSSRPISARAATSPIPSPKSASARARGSTASRRNWSRTRPSISRTPM